jgi:formylglycine-generating enzyme required for sulfatase activity
VNACFGGGIAPFDVGKKTVPDNPGFEGPVSGEVFENSRHEGVSEKINDGASYYGVRNLSGNVWERCVTIGHQLGRIYDGQHGDGELDADGFCNVAKWPGKDGAGAGNRGGVWSSPAPKYLRISLRFAANFPKSEDGKNSGCRLGF